MNDTSHSPSPARQPLLHDAAVVIHAPTQVWARPDGDVGGGAIDGVYLGDTRFFHRIGLSVEGARTEPISTSADAAARVRFTALVRDLDDDAADPKLVLEREREVSGTGMTEVIRLRAHLGAPQRVRVRVDLEPEFATMHTVKAGAPDAAAWEATDAPDGTVVRAGAASAVVSGDGVLTTDAGGVRLVWDLDVPARGSVEARWTATLSDEAMVVEPAASMRRLRSPDTAGLDPRAERWARVALDDLDRLRLRLPGSDDEFYAAGAPWFFTLFGRDSLWAARLARAADPEIAVSTLRVLARLQGRTDDVDSAEEPGKILHELRAYTFHVPGEQVSLPPAYFGTVDATALWVCLFGDLLEDGTAIEELRDLLPPLREALGWLTRHGEAFLSYLDRSGHGLANQGWKDSGDSIQWRDGSLAEGPIALSEVQGYAYEAAHAGARLLDAFGEPGAADLRAWGDALRARFRAEFWVTTPEGHYPAIALDTHGRAVDTLTSNIGHLLGTGILDPDEEREVAHLLVGPTMRSGFGIRTMSSNAGGYWPLSYHGGSVWIHDTAIIARGMLRAGLTEEAELVALDLLAAAEGFGYRVPELHAGFAGAAGEMPVPYPAACRPQAWSAAAAVTAIEVLRATM